MYRLTHRVAATVVALCTSVTFGTATVAFAESQPPCRDITQGGFSKTADTFTCFLQVDDRVIINERWSPIFTGGKQGAQNSGAI
jgi:hypothetical protein